MEAFDSVIEEAWKLESSVEQSHALEGESMLAEKLKHDESSVEASSCQMATELKCHQRDIVAAHILVQMANEDSGLLRQRLNLHGVKPIMKGMPRMRWETEGYTIAGDSHSQVARRKAKFFAKRQQPAFGGQINDANSVVLALSAMPCPGRRKQRKMNSGVELSSVRPKYMKNDVSEDKDDDLYECGVLDGHERINRWGNDNQKSLKACHEVRHDRSGVLRIKKQKRVARSYLKREQNVDVAGTVKIPSHMNNIVSKKETENSHDQAWQFLDGHELPNRWGNNDPKSIEAGLEDRHDRFGMLRINKRKRAARSYIKRETDDVAVPVKIPLKRPFKLAVPTVQGNFPFSIIHLLTAIRRAMVTRHAEGNALVFGKDQGRSNELINGFDSLKIKGVSDFILTNPRGLPYLTLNRIVKHVRSTPIDPRILQTRESLQDLVRGVLKIFSSKKAPLGAEGWKPLTFYHKSRECWLWIGPFNYWDASNLLSIPTPVNEEDMTSEAWGLPHQMLVDLVDSFAIWFNSFLKRLHPIGSLLTPTLNKSERFRGMKRKMNIATISPSSEEVRAHFQKEEALRHLVPDRGFCYTALDGRKSAVAPLRKVNKIGRYHVILKADRPHHISTLCLLRDAAARLPGGMGTRADICILMRDSQYLVEDVSDEQLHQAASQGLDRLHYEVDPCVKYNGNVWVYLHRNRGEEDFEDGATSSTYTRRQQR